MLRQCTEHKHKIQRQSQENTNTLYKTKKIHTTQLNKHILKIWKNNKTMYKNTRDMVRTCTENTQNDKHKLT